VIARTASKPELPNQPSDGGRTRGPPTAVQGRSELLPALPEFILTNAQVDGDDELVAHVELPRGLQACSRCGAIERHRIHDWRTQTVAPPAGGWARRENGVAQPACRAAPRGAGR
jgi:hypothetical protein